MTNSLRNLVLCAHFLPEGNNGDGRRQKCGFLNRPIMTAFFIESVELRRGDSQSEPAIRGQRAAPNRAVRKSEGIAKICGEPRGGCARLDGERDLILYFAGGNHSK
jgi:hypothetical protein